MKSDTYTEQSKRNKLEITLTNLNITSDSSYSMERNKLLDSLFCDLTVFTPTSQSHYGKKLKDYPGYPSSKHYDKFIGKIIKGMGIENVYFYKTFTDRTKAKHDLYEEVTKSKGTLLFLRCENGIIESLYSGIRNSISHGNIVKRDGFYIFYSVSDDKKEYNSTVTFFLKIRKVKCLNTLMKVLKQ